MSELALREGDLRPGMVRRGYAERQLAQISDVRDPLALWRGAALLGTAAQQWNATSLERRELKSAQMFYEIQLSRLLGPRPGPSDRLVHDEDGRIIDRSPHADYGLDGLIPKQRVSELQRLHRWADSLVEAVRNGVLSRRSLLQRVDEWEADERINEHGEPTLADLDIRRGDFRDALADLHPGSVALVLTDPPYPAEYLPLWDELGAWSASRLMVGGSLVAYSGQAHMYEAHRRLERHLRYWWTLALLLPGASQMIPGKWMSAGWKPVLFFVRERRGTTVMLVDRVTSGTPRKTMPTGDDGSWAQSVDPLTPIISALTAPGDLIVDPFAGSGTVGLAALRFGRRFVGADLRTG